jgi:uncharacterized RDD family membrane protein YckC
VSFQPPPPPTSPPQPPGAAYPPPAHQPPAYQPPGYQPPGYQPPAYPPPGSPTFGAPVLPPNVAVANPWARLGSYLLEALLATVTLGIGWLIWAAMIGGTGQTPAKRLLHHRVIRADTLRPAGLGRMFWVRGILAGLVANVAVTCTLGVLLFMPFWDKRRQNLWDKVSNTYVVVDPSDAWGTRPDLRQPGF